jgi:CheY-like chemotaxis protein
VALKRIRSNVYTTNIPVIAVMGRRAQGEGPHRGGAQECLRNPVELEALTQAIDRHRLQELDFTEAPASVLRDKPRLADLNATKLLDTPPRNPSTA